jgi:hypothetical protein
MAESLQQTGFLSLPYELRLRIYQYLIPDCVEFISGTSPKRLPLRLDRVPCCPALLRTNQQIHRELIELFYGSVTFEIIIARSVHVFGNPFSAEARLPSTIRWMRNIRIDISLLPCPQGDNIECREQYNPLMVALIDHLLAMDSNLRQLEIKLLVRHNFYGATVYQEKDLTKCVSGVKYALDPLRSLKGVSIAPVRVWQPDNQLRRLYSCKPGFCEQWESMRNMFRSYVEQIAYDVARTPVFDVL